MRVRSEKGKQREFLSLVIRETGCPSLRELINRGIDASYSALKNYYCERRFLPQNLFEELLKLSGLKKEDFEFEILKDSWGQVKGGRKSRR